MMFYTTVGGWMFAYFFKMARGEFTGLSPQEVSSVFSGLTAQPWVMMFWMAVVVALSFGICSLGLRNGVEKVTKWMMSSLFLIMVVLAVRSVTLPGAGDGLRFYLAPDFGKIVEQGVFNTIFAAMGQAFFTLSIGVGSMAIFGSYLDKSRSLTGESLNIMLLDTAVAVISGLIIFPSCFAFQVAPESGPSPVSYTHLDVYKRQRQSR